MNESELGFIWDVASHPDTEDAVVFIDSERSVSLTASDLRDMLEDPSGLVCGPTIRPYVKLHMLWWMQSYCHQRVTTITASVKLML